MFKRSNACRAEERREMRGGRGVVKIEHFWEPENEMHSRTRMCARLTLAPGDSIGFHRHEGEEEIFVILRGRARVDDNGVTAELLPGDTLLTGGGAGHAVESIGDEPLEMLAVIGKY